MKITDKMRLDMLTKRKKITRIYSGHGSRKHFKTCAWRIVVECHGELYGLRESIDAAIRAGERNK